MIRYETFYTAVQYVSLALAGLPYMGVGRNLAYRKSVFTANGGFRSHQHVVGGDDDLFVGETATRRNVAVSLDPAAGGGIGAQTHLRAWLRQKKRHLAAGKRYRLRNKALLGALPLAQGVFWAAGYNLSVPPSVYSLRGGGFSGQDVGTGSSALPGRCRY
jgi:hypothetical protein